MLNQQEIEKEILQFWEKKKVFIKLQEKNRKGEKWSFIDGPITANNPMGVHHAWGRTYKDLFQRFKAMQGYNQRFQNGFDCQGLWVEREEEKDLGLKNKEDIEKFGVLNFVKACKKRVEKFSKIQTEQSIKLGQWMNWDNSYYTMSDSNQLHNWMLLKTYFDKKMLYKGGDVVPWCPRCGTASSKHDIATEGYKEVTHKALFMKFPLTGKKDEYFIIFTTTPWTVPANVIIAVNEKINYVKIKQDDSFYWLAEKRLNEIKGGYEIIEKKKGKQLEGIKYEMPYKDLKQQKDSPHKVVLWGLASEEEGTGIVHCAPGCGAEDFVLGKKLKFPAISPLDDAGVYEKDYGSFSNKKYSQVNQEVLKDLEQKGLVYKIENYRHRYPHCWRCGEELVFRLVDEWYIECKEIRDKLIKENEKINWFPEYGKTRQKDWFENMNDWLISRKRYWGLPLPIWECKCGKIEVIGSLEELREKAIDKKKVDSLPEIHRPWIDGIKIKCKKCGKEVSRILDVGDAWLDAGIVPFSTLDYLGDKKGFENWFPANFICENMPGQYRGWFNALMWASVTITGKAPFKSILGYETLKDEKGEEMHKSKGNTIWFDDAVEKIGADPMRLLYCLQDPTQELRFGYHVAKEPKNNLNIFYNISNLIELTKEEKISKIEDKWIISKLNSLVKQVTEELECLHLHIATRTLQDFWIYDFSRKYIQLTRDRISSGDKEVKFGLKEVYLTLLKLLAPICPFITEKIWQDLRVEGIVKEESVHLCAWPKYDTKKIDEKLEEEMKSVYKIIEAGLAVRDSEKIGLKWPLSKAIVYNDKELSKEFNSIIERQLNVKKIEFSKNKEFKVELDLKMTPELEAEGFVREIARNVQDARKKAGLVKENEIELAVIASRDMVNSLVKFRDFLAERVNAKKIEILDKTEKKYVNSAEFSVKDKKISIKFNVLN
jgi:isoleucyl-tRNA synthetase